MVWKKVQRSFKLLCLLRPSESILGLLLQDALTHRIEGYKFDVLQARNGLEAVEMVKESADLALVLMDTKMPHSKQVAIAICLIHLTLLSCCVWLGNYFVYLFGDLFHLFGLR